jgi:sugar (pentulose or hexulose) kinase
MKYYLILDIGKTRVKLQLINQYYKICENFDKYNCIGKTRFYPCVDVDGIWNWLLKLVKKISIVYKVDAINISAHGATVALINENFSCSGLVFPIIDYEWNGVESEVKYFDIRPKFIETRSPYLPSGLNLGQQLFWF